MDWNHIYGDIKRVANTAAEKIGHTATLATLQVKLSMAEQRLEEAYTALGRVSYDHFTSDEDLVERVAAAVAAVNGEKAHVMALKAEIAARKIKTNTSPDASTGGDGSLTDETAGGPVEEI